MGRKTKKSKADKPSMSKNIGDLWRQAQRAEEVKMAAYADFASDISEELLDEAVEEQVLPLQAPKPPPAPPDTAPVTTAILKDLLAGLQHTLQADVAQIRQDLRGLTGRMATLEQNTSLNAKHIAQLQQTVGELTQQEVKMEQRLSAAEDHRRSLNLKVRGITENTAGAELPILARRLLHALLPPKQAKAVEIKGLFRIPKPVKAQAGAPRDLIILFQRSKDKIEVLNAVRNHSSYSFESMALSFFTDLLRNTLT
ncbi:Hypothetical predicted protein [Pelobates cultripes]|uniref:Uncharacterized protein n=1 Tax=Pelobates cultripes TaxID=61616 RepID=A0AAD1TEX5_PELCU|nr:Hypothetical predicted protein [Pelobates cultripes]